MKYQHLAVNCDLCEISMREAALVVGPSFVYDLHVHPSNQLWAARILKDLAAQTRENPLAPYVNLRPDEELERQSEWVLVANGRCVGSPGVW